MGICSIFRRTTGVRSWRRKRRTSKATRELTAEARATRCCDIRSQVTGWWTSGPVSCVGCSRPGIPKPATVRLGQEPQDGHPGKPSWSRLAAFYGGVGARDRHARCRQHLLLRRHWQGNLVPVGGWGKWRLPCCDADVAPTWTPSRGLQYTVAGADSSFSSERSTPALFATSRIGQSSLGRERRPVARALYTRSSTTAARRCWMRRRRCRSRIRP